MCWRDQPNPNAYLKEPCHVDESTRRRNQLQALAQSMHEHWVMFLVEGIVLLVPRLACDPDSAAGHARCHDPVGWLFLISGVVGSDRDLLGAQAPGFWWSLVSAVLGIAAGLVLLVSPVSGALSLTLILIVFFVIEGVATIMYALEHRQRAVGTDGAGCW